jgi:hypothetical protein
MDGLRIIAKYLTKGSRDSNRALPEHRSTPASSFLLCFSFNEVLFILDFSSLDSVGSKETMIVNGKVERMYKEAVLPSLGHNFLGWGGLRKSTKTPRIVGAVAEITIFKP